MSSCTTIRQSSSTEKFKGMWRLDKFETLDSLTGNWNIDSARMGYTGYILYDGLGHMSVEQNPPGYSRFTINKSIDSLDKEDLKKVAKLYRSNYTYTGNYTIEGKTITHKRLSATNPKDWNTALKRDFEFRGDTLILTTQEKINGTKLRIRWIKV